MATFRPRRHAGIILCLLLICVAALPAQTQPLPPQLNHFLNHCRVFFFDKLQGSEYDNLPLDDWARVLGAAYRLQWDKMESQAEGQPKVYQRQYLEALWLDLQKYVTDVGDGRTTGGWSGAKLAEGLRQGFWTYGFGDEPENQLARLIGIADSQVVSSIFDWQEPAPPQPVDDNVNSGNDRQAGDQPPINGHWEILSATCSYSIRGTDPRRLYRYYRYVIVENGVRHIHFYLYPSSGTPSEEPSPKLELLGYEYLDRILRDIKEWCNVVNR